MDKILEQITEKLKIQKIDEDCFQILTSSEITDGVSVKIFIKRKNGKIYLCDDKNTLRFMNKKYELTAPDVKMCINDVVKYYGFAIDKGEIITELKAKDNYSKRYNDLIVCCCTLANMFIFFDSPQE